MDYIFGICEKRKCKVFALNCEDDHVHILLKIHPEIAAAALIKAIKVGSNLFIREHSLFPKFRSWQVGYGLFVCEDRSKDRLIRYIQNQEAHHKKFDSAEELRKLLKKYRIEYDAKFFE